MGDNNLHRRSLLKKGVIGGVAGSFGLAYVPRRTNAVETVKIVTARGSGEIKKTAEVPEEWYEHVERSRKVIDRIRSELQQHRGVSWLERSPSVEQIHGLNKPEIVARVNSSDYEGGLPSDVDGVKIQTEETTELDVLSTNRCADSGCYNACDFSPVPGGVAIKGETGAPFDPGPNEGEKYHIGTSCCRVKRNGSKKLLTAAHLFHRYKSSDYSGECDSNKLDDRKAFQNGDQIGSVAEGYTSPDWVTIDSDPNSSFDNTIEGESGTIGTVRGYVTSNGVDHLMSNNTTVYQMGVHSGKTSGKVEADDAGIDDGCPDMEGAGIRTSTTVADGDSGGPIFDQSKNDIYIICMTNYGTSSNGTSSCLGTPIKEKAYGYPAHLLNDFWGIKYDT
jgi:hypothetical protein